VDCSIAKDEASNLGRFSASQNRRLHHRPTGTAPVGGVQQRRRREDAAPDVILRLPGEAQSGRGHAPGALGHRVGNVLRLLVVVMVGHNKVGQSQSQSQSQSQARARARATATIRISVLLLTLLFCWQKRC